MGKTLHISEDLALPLDAVTQKLAFLGRTGSGKTYAAMKLAEEMLDANAQIVCLDPVGVWYGLRLAPNGKDAGLSIPILGGLHGDIPLESTAGELIADVIVDRAISAVVDVSQMIQSEQQRFGRAFATRLFERRKKAPSAMMLFIEECQEFVPQNPMKGDEHMLHAFNRLVKIGRNFGIGVSLISQRPQEVNKKVLNLTECMFTFQMTGPQERKTIREWVSYVGDDVNIVDRLPRLKVGEAHVSSPQWLQVSCDIQIAQKRTYNASSTPTVGAKPAEVKPLAPIDLAKIRADMAATIERAKADDPRELRKRITELERQLKAQATQPSADPKALADAREQGRNDVRFAMMGASKPLDRLREISLEIADQLNAANKHLAAGGFVMMGSATAPESKPVTNPPRQAPSSPPQKSNARVRSAASDNGELSGPARKIIQSLQQLEALSIPKMPRTLIAAMTGYSNTRSTGFAKAMSQLASKGHINYPSSDEMVLTETGRLLLPAPDAPLTEKELHSRVLEVLGGKKAEMMKLLIDQGSSGSIAKDDLMQALGYTNDRSTGFAKALSTLGGFGLIRYPERGMVKAMEFLFL